MAVRHELSLRSTRARHQDLPPEVYPYYLWSTLQILITSEGALPAELDSYLQNGENRTLGLLRTGPRQLTVIVK